MLLWERAREPFRGTWALPGGVLAPGETLEDSIRRHLAAKVDVREVSHLEQLATYSDPVRDPRGWELATAYLGLVQLGLDPHVPADTRWHPVDELPPIAFDHGAIVLAARERLRGKLSLRKTGLNRRILDRVSRSTFRSAGARRFLRACWRTSRGCSRVCWQREFRSVVHW